MKESKRSYFCNCLYFSTSALARNLTRLAEEAFLPTGLAPSYAFVLMTVNRNPGTTPSAIAEEMRMQPSTITRFLDKLEAKGYLERRSEGKSSMIHPTDKCLLLNEKLQECWESLYEKYHDLLGTEMTHVLSSNVTEANERLT